MVPRNMAAPPRKEWIFFVWIIIQEFRKLVATFCDVKDDQSHEVKDDTLADSGRHQNSDEHAM